MYNRKEIESILCELRGTPKLTDLEKLATSAAEMVCGRSGIGNSGDLYRVLQYIAQNGYAESDRWILQELVTRRYNRGF